MIQPLYAHPYTKIFATVFALAAFAGGVFGVGQAKSFELASAYVYAGGALGVLFSGDFISLFFFWEIMAPKSDLTPKGELLEAINKTFSSFDKFSEEFSSKALGVFGSGWAFLVLTPQKELKLKRQSFQNSPISDGNIPLLGIDVWEHAYYLKYQNRRAEYVKAWWNVVNWNKVEEIFRTSF